MRSVPSISLQSHQPRGLTTLPPTASKSSQQFLLQTPNPALRLSILSAPVPPGAAPNTDTPPTPPFGLSLGQSPAEQAKPPATHTPLMLPPRPGCARSVNNITPTPTPLQPLTVFREQSRRKASFHSNRPPANIPPASSSTDRSSITSKCGVPTCPRSPQSPFEWPLGPRPSPRAVPDPRTSSPPG